MIKRNAINIIIAFCIVAIITYITTLIGGEKDKVLVMTGILTLFILGIVDLTNRYYKKVGTLIILILGSVILGNIAAYNIYLSICINIVWLVILIYLTLQNFNTLIYIPILCVYLINLNFSDGKLGFNYLYLVLVFIIGLILNYIFKKKIKVRMLEELEYFKTDNKFKYILFAIKISIIVTIVYFIIKYFKISYGDWILFGVVGFVFPYNTENKLIDKNIMLGTLIGALRIFIVASIVPLYPVRMGILAVGAYLCIFSKKYRIRAMGGMMFVFSMTEVNTGFLTINITHIIQKLIFIIIAFIVGIICTKVIVRKI